MEPSLAIVPSSSTTSSVSIASTASPLGLHDALRYGTRSLAADVAPKHPLQNRLEQWDETQENLQLTMQRNLYGLHAPVRLLMERSLVSQSPLPASFVGLSKPSNLHLDILTGRDETVSVSDVLVDRAASGELEDFGIAMEKKLRMF